MQTNTFPTYFRLVSLVRLPLKGSREILNEAVLYHDDAQITAVWTSSHVDSRLKRGCCVALRGACTSQLENGRLPVSRVELIDKPISAVNPFQTVPVAWCPDRVLVQKAAVLWSQMGRSLQHLFNAVMWDGGRFYRYITGPLGSSDYPWAPGRNFKHAVAVTEKAAVLTRGLPDISNQVLIAAALLHDAGKADDYRLSAEGYVLSDRGYWIGYQNTILEWLAVARSRVIVSDAQYLALVHALIARRTYESRSGLSIEATLLATADRLTNEAVSPAFGS
ncbi:HD domain-containing protein [Azonexus hydrophilus]|uniref:HD domain-containing protein n=1 Tax=Azonexus hydrophilus TaxID=418702 RepID=A0ABZ2XHW6_9RHOO